MARPLLYFSPYDQWRTREPEDDSELVERVEEEIASGDWDGALLERLSRRPNAFDELVNDLFGYNEDIAREIIWNTPEGEKLREELIERAKEPPEPPMPWD